MADGSIVLEAEIDQKKIAADLARLKKRITDLQTKQAVTLQLRGDAAAKLDDISVKLDTAKAKLAEMEAAGMQGTAEFERQKVAVGAMQTEFDALEGKVRRYDHALANSSEEIQRAQTELSKLPPAAKEAAASTTALEAAAENVSSRIERIAKRIKRLTSRVLVFTVIAAALRVFRDFVSSALERNEAFRNSLSKLRGALLVGFAPLWQAIVPWLIAFVNILTRAITIINTIVGALFGIGDGVKQSAKALGGQSDAIDGVGSAAKKASKQLANFDEINQLSGDDSGAGAGGGAGGAGVGGLDTEFDLQGKISRIEKILAGSLLVIGAILTFSGVNIPLGIALMAMGALTLATAAGVDWNAVAKFIEENNTKILTILGSALLVLGAILAFSGANIPLGIGLMIAGAAALGGAVKLNWNSISKFISDNKDTITKIVSVGGAALLMLGAVLTFSNAAIGLGIALMAAGAAGLATAVGLNWDAIKDYISNNKDAIYTLMAVGGMAFLVLGLILALSKAAIGLGIGLMIVGASALASSVALNWDAIREYIANNKSEIYAIMAGVSAGLLVLGIILTVAGVLPLGISLIIAGAAGLVTITSLNWNAITDKVKEIWGNIKTFWNSSIAPVFTKEWWANKFDSIRQGMKDSINATIAIIERGLNAVVNKINTFGFTIPDWVPEFGGKRFGFSLPNLSIPRLAEGAVIPPNRQFMAVLGDQKSGTNIETPLSTMVQAFKQALAESGGGSRTVILEVDKRQFGKVTFDAYNMESGRVGVRLGET